MNFDPELRIGVIGLGYVGLPVAVAMARAHGNVVGFDISARRIWELQAGIDRTREVDPLALRHPGLCLTADPSALRDRNLFIITIPTPVDRNRQPDLKPLRACLPHGRLGAAAGQRRGV